MKAYVVEVSCLVDFDELDAEDRNEDGECSVDGCYGLRLTGDLPEVLDSRVSGILTERVLDIFHDEIGIACLDDFEIVVRPASEQDIQGWETMIVHDLGDHDSNYDPEFDEADPDDDEEPGT